MLNVMDKSTHEEHPSQPLQTNNKQCKIAVTFLTGCHGTFNVTNSSNKFYFAKSINDKDGFFQITLPPGAYAIESLNKQIRRIIVAKEQYAESIYPFKIKPNFSKLGSVIEISTQGPIFTFQPDDSLKDLSAFNKTRIYE